MNRFTGYLESQKLAKQFILSAEEKIKKNDNAGAVRLLIGAVREQMTACNNIASLYFQRRKKI